MNESEYLAEWKRLFSQAHPREDGWLVYEFSSRLREEEGLDYLVDFLRDARPEAVKRRKTYHEVRTQDMAGEKGDSHDVGPGSEWDRKELDTRDWTGEIELEWRGQAVHYAATRLVGFPEDADNRMLAATKSNAALRDLQAAVREYSETRKRRKDKWIKVVNGEDIRVPNVGWDDVLLPQGLAEEIRSNLTAFFDEKTRDRYNELGIPYRRGFIFAGPPGCGKTQTLRAVANTVKASLVALHATAGLADRELASAFRSAKRRAPAVLIIEDLDRVARGRDVGMSHLLNMLDGLKVTEGVLVIATSNHPEKLDPALLHRPSRFDRISRFSLPALKERRTLLDRKGGKFFSAAALDEVAKASQGFSMAYVQEIVVNALLKSLNDGGAPDDRHLRESAAELKRQRKMAAKAEEDRLETEAIGFVGSEGGRADLEEFLEDIRERGE